MGLLAVKVTNDFWKVLDMTEDFEKRLQQMMESPYITSSDMWNRGCCLKS